MWSSEKENWRAGRSREEVVNADLDRTRPTAQPQVVFKTIRLATDFSEASQVALRYAATVGRLHYSKVFIVHVVSHAKPDISIHQKLTATDTISTSPQAGPPLDKGSSLSLNVD